MTSFFIAWKGNDLTSFSRISFSSFSLLKVRIRESNFHSSLIQGAQNFDKIVTSGNSASGNIKDTSKPEDKKPKASPPRSESDSKMPVEQLTSHVLSGGHHPTTHQAVNALLLLLALITIFGNRQWKTKKSSSQDISKLYPKPPYLLWMWRKNQCQ